MRITADCIDHNVSCLVNDLTSTIYELDSDQQKEMVLGEIRGICDLADVLKEVLKA